MYSVRLLKAATRELARLDKPIAQRVANRIKWLAENIEQISPQALKGELAGLYKLREGDYRIIYEILHDEETIVIHSIGHRREIYEKKR
jgi:mRNA interferase RelE/StbE